MKAASFTDTELLDALAEHGLVVQKETYGEWSCEFETTGRIGYGRTPRQAIATELKRHMRRTAAHPKALDGADRSGPKA